MFTRSFTPIYPKSKEEVIDELMSEIKKQGWALMQNPQPVDMEWKNNQRRKCRCDHKTIFFDDNFIDRALVWDMFYYSGYECREVPEKDKSIQEIRHFHAVKVLEYLD